MEASLLKDLETSAPGTSGATETLLNALRFNDAGLVPAVAQDANTNEVLMLAWMNREAIELTLGEGRVTYFSRSRNELWRKGDTSGHTQQLQTMRVDCDGDALLLEVNQTGPACHTNRQTCFYLHVDKSKFEVRA